MIAIETRDAVSLLRLEHKKANAIDLELLSAIDDALDAVVAAKSRGVVVTGTGSMFSAGVDLFRVMDGGAPYLDAFLPQFTRTFQRLWTFPRPIVAAVNGHAIAGGCVLAAACDHRIVARGSAKIGVTELLLSVPFPSTALEIMRAAVPPPHFHGLVYDGRLCDPEEAVRVGLMDVTVAPDELLDAACQAASRRGAIHPDSFALTKRQIRAPHLARCSTADDADVAALWSHPDVQKAIADYVAKTVGRASSDS